MNGTGYGRWNLSFVNVDYDGGKKSYRRDVSIPRCAAAIDSRGIALFGIVLSFFFSLSFLPFFLFFRTQRTERNLCREYRGEITRYPDFFVRCTFSRCIGYIYRADGY